MLAREDRPLPDVRLRPALTSDAALFLRWRAEPSVRRYQPLRDVSLAQLRADLSNQNLDDFRRSRGDRFQWVIEADRLPVGWITLVVSNWEHGLSEIGFALSTPHQRRGIMPVALQELLPDLFLRSRIERVEARCAVDNHGSRQVLERVGFQREGILREYFDLRGTRTDHVLYSLLRRDLLPPAGWSSD